MAAGLLFSSGLYLFIFGYFYDWHPSKPLLVFGTAMTLLIVGGIWLWDEIRDLLGSATTAAGTEMRAILEAKIAELKELAGQLKGLSEMKQRLAEDTEYPPHNAEQLRQTALEHKRDAIAALTGAEALKVVAAEGTKAKQIALMRHYVLEFGQSASRNAKLSNSLADDDPRKEKVVQSGLSDTFVVTLLNSILNDITSKAAQVSPRPTAHPSMAGRPGQVLSWTANLIALAIAAIFLVIAATTNDTYSAGAVVLTGVVIAAVVWALGRALRYVLAGT